MHEQLITLIREAGEIMKSARDIERGIEVKEGDANFVTEYDSAVQKFLFEKLALLYPEAAFVGEEDSADDIARLTSGKAFVIDPIDGTTNFIKHFGHSCISVALCENGETVLGIVYNPYTDEMYCAEAGKGAWLLCGGKRRTLQVSRQPLENGLSLIGTSPYYTQLHDRTFSVMRTLFEHSLDIRRCGSAALDLCMIADGRAEVYFEAILSPWDYAAGMLIVREAGGIVTQPDGTPLQMDRKCGILAGNPAAYEAAKLLLA
ncbi:MAG: inositol monophosphatase [Ruminococcaceae bacterium]|nr:inositol monophosphatase [Oscillospiraceae bacterium]